MFVKDLLAGFSIDNWHHPAAAVRAMDRLSALDHRNGIGIRHFVLNILIAVIQFILPTAQDKLNNLLVRRQRILNLISFRRRVILIFRHCFTEFNEVRRHGKTLGIGELTHLQAYTLVSLPTNGADKLQGGRTNPIGKKVHVIQAL